MLNASCQEISLIEVELSHIMNLKIPMIKIEMATKEY